MKDGLEKKSCDNLRISEEEVKRILEKQSTSMSYIKLLIVSKCGTIDVFNTHNSCMLAYREPAQNNKLMI